MHCVNVVPIISEITVFSEFLEMLLVTQWNEVYAMHYRLHLFGRFCAYQKVTEIGRNVFSVVHAISQYDVVSLARRVELNYPLL